VAPWLDPDRKLSTHFFDDFVLDGGLLGRTEGITVFYSDNDQKSVLKSVEILREEIRGISFREFHGYGHFCIDDMHTIEFPELLEECLKEK
jgi:hypothetical protein